VSQSGFETTTTTSQAVTIQAGKITAPAIAIAGASVMGGTVLVTATIPNGVRATYQWLRNGSSISSATKTSYSMKADDVNQHLSVRVTLTKTGYVPTTATSSTVVVTAGTLTRTATPVVSGNALVGKTLTATTGGWDSGTKFTYQWLRSGAAISGATTKTYKLTASDRGTAISFSITATKPGYIPVTRVSVDTVLN
jgi:hypothetical protein